MSRRLAVVSELPEPVQELVRSGGLPAHAAMKHLVPLARAKTQDWQALAAAVAAHGLSSRQVPAKPTVQQRAVQQRAVQQRAVQQRAVQQRHSIERLPPMEASEGGGSRKGLLIGAFVLAVALGVGATGRCWDLRASRWW